MNTTSTMSNQPQFAKFYYEHNNNKINIHTDTFISNVLVSFNINGKNISTYIRSLSKIFDNLIHIDFNNIQINKKIKKYKINNNLQNILNNVNDLLYEDKIDIFDCIEFYDKIIYVKIICNYRYSKESLHGYTNL